jgi:predicted HicB family RNase H-like nuclease
MSFDASAYNISVRRTSTADGSVFVARVLELPDVRGFGDSASEAYDRAVEAIETLHDSAEEDHEGFPSPIEPEEEYSGRVTLRMPKTLHRDVAIQAEREDVSINSYIVTAIARTLTPQNAAAQSPGFQLAGFYGAACVSEGAVWPAGYLSGLAGYPQSASILTVGPAQGEHDRNILGSSTSAMIRIFESKQPTYAFKNPIHPEADRERRRA